MIGESRRRLTTSELEHVGQYFWNAIVETASKDKLSIRSAMRNILAESRLMVELLRNSVSFGRPGDKQSRAGGQERKQKPNPNDKDKPKNAPKQKYWTEWGIGRASLSQIWLSGNRGSPTQSLNAPH